MSGLTKKKVAFHGEAENNGATRDLWQICDVKSKGTVNSCRTVCFVKIYEGCETNKRLKWVQKHIEADHRIPL